MYHTLIRSWFVNVEVVHWDSSFVGIASPVNCVNGKQLGALASIFAFVFADFSHKNVMRWDLCVEVTD